MLILKTVSYKNFMGVGNHPITIDLERSPTTLIGGSNGAGKSTLLEAICFALFGKTLKKVSLPSLVNSTNKKALEVKIGFVANGTSYSVLRGMKPNKFIISREGEEIPQNASKKDYQAKLENIIGYDFKLFSQVVLLNRERYQPFMELDAPSRRKVVEDILDISVISEMNKLNKERLKKFTIESKDLEYRVDKASSAVEAAEKVIQMQKQDSEDRISEQQQVVDEAKSALEAAVDEYQAFDVGEFDDTNLKNLKVKRDRFSNSIVEATTIVKSVSKENEFLRDNEDCPTCTQKIDDGFRNEKVSINDAKVSELNEVKADLEAAKVDVVDQIKILSDQAAEHAERVREKDRLASQANRLAKAYESQKLRLSEIEKKVQSKEVPDIARLMECLSEEEEKLESVLSDIEICNVTAKVLADDAAKADIVNDYIGFINKRMNEFMNDMEFFVNITLDGNFNESFNNINKENFTYNSLSTGQKTRLNMALWLTLLEVSSMKNSAVVNVLFLDEILENLDQDGVSLFMKLVNNKLNTKNVFVVTQRFDEFKDYFRSELRFKQDDQEFTILE